MVPSRPAAGQQAKSEAMEKKKASPGKKNSPKAKSGPKPKKVPKEKAAPKKKCACGCKVEGNEKNVPAAAKSKAKAKGRAKAKSKPLKKQVEKVLKTDWNNVYSRSYHAAIRMGKSSTEAGFLPVISLLRCLSIFGISRGNHILQCEAPQL